MTVTDFGVVFEKETYIYAEPEDADTDLYLGFGMHWGEFTLDGMMDDSQLL